MGQKHTELVSTGIIHVLVPSDVWGKKRLRSFEIKVDIRTTQL